MVMLNVRLAVAELLSVIAAVNVNVPGAEGVPEMPPVGGFKLRPGGKAPALMDQVYGAFALDARSVCEYGTPRDPPGSRGAVVTVNDETIVMLICRVAVTDPASVTCAVKLNVPATAGVPAIRPFEARERPVGNEPALMDHEYDGVPPEAVSIWA